ncbi:MAG: extracellular solute-binding protein, partial [Aeromicrobium sp.]
MQLRTNARLLTAIGLSAALLLPACGPAADESGKGNLVIYAGRDEALLSPLIKQFTKDTGVEVDVRYAETPEFTATLLEEGERSPADVFISQDAGALGALSAEGMLKKLPADITGAVFKDYTSTDDTWVGVTGRARVIAYDGEELDADEVPGAVEEFTEPEWKGRVGFPPTNA